MVVALSGIGELGISGYIAVRPCLIGASPAISHTVDAEDIVESDDRVNMAVSGAAEETGLPGFCDYYVIGQFHLVISSIGINGGTVCRDIVVGNRVIDEYRSTDSVGN